MNVRTPAGLTVPSPAPAPHDGDERVILLDAVGRHAGTTPKALVHHRSTPLHLAFSCHVVDAEGRVLLTRRATSKRTWPATWSNACCGHPGPGETLRTAVTRRLASELGLTPLRMGLAIPDFVYRAAMDGGVIEHELCPVVIAQVGDEPTLDPAEADGSEWLAWEAVHERAVTRPHSLSPWAVAQIERLAALAPSPLAWLDEHVTPGPTPGPAARRATPPSGRRPVGEIGLDAPLAAASLPGHGGVDPLTPVREPVDRLLAEFVADRERDLAALGPGVAEVGREIRRLVAAGGKRLRPAFVYWGHRAAGGAHDEQVLAAGAAVELLHSFALIHDDVMDRSARRRGQPTTHVALAELHRRDGLRGDGRWFGLSGALLAGDLAFVWADQMFDAADLSGDALDRARRVFSELRVEVIAGQYLDLRLASTPEPDEETARRVALLKSARYTVTRPLQLGVALAGAAAHDDADLGAAIARYGDAVGLAFQMRDDILGLFGDPATTGKSCLDDLREGKRTLLILRALRLTSGRDHQLLASSLGNPDLDEATAARCRQVVAESGALASVEALLDSERARAVDAISGLYRPARVALEGLAGLAVHREG